MLTHCHIYSSFKDIQEYDANQHTNQLLIGFLQRNPYLKNENQNPTLGMFHRENFI